MIKWLATVFAVVSVAAPAFAQDPSVSGSWRLSAKVASVPFNLICRFEQLGDHIDGNCIDASKRNSDPGPGEGLAVTRGHVDGDHVSFSHGGHFLFNKFNVNYAGVVEGDHMSGRINVFGHTGDFTAVRTDG